MPEMQEGSVKQAVSISKGTFDVRPLGDNRLMRLCYCPECRPTAWRRAGDGLDELALLDGTGQLDRCAGVCRTSGLQEALQADWMCGNERRCSKFFWFFLAVPL
jgi:hypothetical protein